MLLIELFLQLTFPPIPYGYKTFRGPKSKVYGWASFPNKQYVFINPDTGVVSYFNTNSQGWKDVEHNFKKHDYATRILFIGDSITWGIVDLNDLYAREVERLLRKQGFSNIEVISIGGYAWGTDQILEALVVEGIYYSPDIVVYQFTDNDIINNILPRETTRQGSLYWKKPFRYEINNGALKRIKVQPPTMRMVKDGLLRSAIAYHLNYARHTIRAHLNSRIRSRGKAGHAAHTTRYNPNSSYFMYSAGEEPENTREGWKLFEVLLIQMKRVSVENDSEFVVFGVTGDSGKRLREIKWNRFQTDDSSDFVMQEGKKYVIDFERPLKNLSKICEQHEIPLIRPTSQYARYDNDGHPNSIGNRRMAQDVVQFLLNWEPFKERPRNVR